MKTCPTKGVKQNSQLQRRESYLPTHDADEETWCVFELKESTIAIELLLVAKINRHHMADEDAY